VLHGYPDDAAVQILRNCRTSLPDDGRILIVEFALPDVIDRADPDLEKRLLSDLNMLAVTGGRERSTMEWRTLVTRSGLRCNRVIPVPDDGNYHRMRDAVTGSLFHEPAKRKAMRIIWREPVRS